MLTTHNTNKAIDHPNSIVRRSNFIGFHEKVIDVLPSLAAQRPYNVVSYDIK